MNKYYHTPLIIIIVSGIILSLSSCWDDITYRDTDYPEQLIYMPTAYYNNGQLIINDINRVRGELPIEGNPYKYVIDLEKREFRVPLAVYRSGINNEGAFTVDIKVNNDTIAKLNESREDKLLLISSDKYSLVNSVEVRDGQELAQFDLIVDLAFLKENYPDHIYAIGVEVSSPYRDTNTDLSTTVIIIYTEIIKPTSDFSFSIDSSKRSVTFNNTSLMSEKYEWNFGDGSPSSNIESPTHTYSSSGTFNVTLTALGITGDEDKSVISKEIVIE